MKTTFGQKYPILSKRNKENIEKNVTILLESTLLMFYAGRSVVFPHVRRESSVSAETTNSDPPLAFPLPVTALPPKPPFHTSFVIKAKTIILVLKSTPSR